jgi:hypothetical protein
MEDYVMTRKEHRHLFELLVWMLVGLSLTLLAVNTFPGIERFWFEASFPEQRSSPVVYHEDVIIGPESAIALGVDAIAVDNEWTREVRESFKDIDEWWKTVRTLPYEQRVAAAKIFFAAAENKE